MRSKRNITFINGALTASGNSLTFDLGDAEQIVATLDVSAASGTSPTLDVVIEDSADGSVWNTLATFTQKTTIATEVLRITNAFHNRVRAKYTLGGTSPNFTATLKTTVK
jgi:hypothetical protein